MRFQSLLLKALFGRPCPPPPRFVGQEPLSPPREARGSASKGSCEASSDVFSEFSEKRCLAWTVVGPSPSQVSGRVQEAGNLATLAELPIVA